MPNLYLDDFTLGYDVAIKLASDLFSQDTGDMFPFSSSQSKWKYHRSEDHLHLVDGYKTHSFKFPKEHTEEPFEVTKVESKPIHEITETRTAQVHRSDPGSIYFTLQAGKENPTYTLKHVQGNTWKAIPKKKKEVKIPNVDTTKVLEGFKQANILEDIGRMGFHTAMLPGEIQPGWARPLVGAGIGGLYHLGRRGLYNTQAENEEEDKDNTLLKRVALPAAALTLVGGLQRGIFGPKQNDDGTPMLDRNGKPIPDYYTMHQQGLI